MNEQTHKASAHADHTLEATDSQAAARARLADLPLELSVNLPTRRLRVGELLALRPGDQLSCLRGVGEPFNVAVNGDVILRGRDATAVSDGDEVEVLTMLAGG